MPNIMMTPIVMATAFSAVLLFSKSFSFWATDAGCGGLGKGGGGRNGSEGGGVNGGLAKVALAPVSAVPLVLLPTRSG